MAEDAAASGNERDCAWCKIMEQKICKPQYDAFDACMEREGDKGDERCMELFDALHDCMNQRPSLLTMLASMVLPAQQAQQAAAGGAAGGAGAAQQAAQQAAVAAVGVGGGLQQQVEAAASGAE